MTAPLTLDELAALIGPERVKRLPMVEPEKELPSKKRVRLNATCNPGDYWLGPYDGNGNRRQMPKRRCP